MKKPYKDWYSIEEVGQEWELPENDIYHFIYTGRVTPLILLHQVRARPLDGDKVFGRKAGRYLGEKESCYEQNGLYSPAGWSFKGHLDFFMNHNLPFELTYACVHPFGDDTITLEIQPDRDSFDGEMLQPPVCGSVVITIEELLGFEKENSKTTTPIPPYLDRDHKYFAPELAALVEVWLELYEEGKYKENVAHKAQITAMLKKKGLSLTAIKEITRVANPNKPGGATKTA